MDIKALIIDDEERGIDVLSRMLGTYCPSLHVAGVATDIVSGVQLIKSLKPDVVFLDVEMPGGNGFKLLEHLEPPDFEVIFVTAYNEYAIRAIKFSALDYLLKPVHAEELQQAVERLRLRLQQKSGSSPLRHFKDHMTKGNPFSKIVLNDHNGFYFVEISNIIYCEAHESYTHFYLAGGSKHTVSRPLKEYEDLLSELHFFRIHKSYLINLSRVASVSKEYQVVMDDKTELPLSFRKRNDFFQTLRDMHSM